MDTLTLEFAAAASLAAAVSCLEFCSNVFAVFTPMFDRCFELSFACCITVFHESRFENIMLFVSLIADTVLSATLLTNLAYALVAASGDENLVTNPLKLSLYGAHADWSELMISFCESMYSLKSLLRFGVIAPGSCLRCC